MKVIKAFIHQHRAADVIQGLKAAGGVSNLFVTNGHGMLVALDAGEQHYSMDLADTVSRNASWNCYAKTSRSMRWWRSFAGTHAPGNRMRAGFM